NYCTGLTMTNAKFDRLFGLAARDEQEPLQQIHRDIGASAQVVLEDAMLKLTRGLAAEYPQRNLCMAGGVALNCVANGKILRDGKFDQIWVQPAAGDAGGALGAALVAYHYQTNAARKPKAGDGMSGAFLGPSYDEEDIRRRLTAEGARFEVVEDEPALLDRTAQAL